ncbi:MAG: hypothetical protein ACREA2_03810 [Blastocatellia bacterium]
MSNLGKNMMKAIALLLLLAPVQGLGASQTEEQCSKVKSAQIVRVDDESKRVFAQIKPDQISTQRKAKSVLLSLQEKITACYPHFGKEWNVSFFSDKKYAVYKSERAGASASAPTAIAQARHRQLQQMAVKLSLDSQCS